jgi:hypothetical protein
MKRAYVVIGFVLMCGIGMSAQQPKPHWPQEPTSFLGIAFGQPLRASVVACPQVTEYGSTRYEWVHFGRACFEPKRNFYELYNMSPFFNVFVEELNGNVEYISAKFNNGNAASMATVDAGGIAASLIAKFGTADFSGTEILHNNSGATYEDRILRWKGKNVEIDFDSVSGEYNHGSVCAYTATYAAYVARQQERQQNTLKDIF